MKAIVIEQYGGVENLSVKEIPRPVPEIGEVLIRVKAFGLNRAEIYMRRGLWGDVAKVSGIECVGEVVLDPENQFIEGQTVAAIMGGMGRTRNGSYAEYTCLSKRNIFALEINMNWTDLAAIPESYATAWSCLHENMKIKEGDTVFIRGGTSALGQAAINIASNINNVTVFSSTRTPEKIGLLESIGCSEVFIEGTDLSLQLRERLPDGVDSVLDIIGNKTLLDSLRMVRKSGFVCNAGFLGGTEPIRFNPLADMPSSVNLNFFASFMYGSEDFSLSDIPMQTIVNQASKGRYKTKPTHVFDFNDIALAHEMLEDNAAYGKIVVSI